MGGTFAGAGAHLGGAANTPASTRRSYDRPTMLDTYRRILSRPGAARFSLTALVARLPISMIGLGIVLLVESESGSYGLAGSVSAVALVANAALVVVQGRLDRPARAGPGAAGRDHRVGRRAVAADGDGGVGLADHHVVRRSSRLPAPPCRPSGSCVRARWAHVLPDAHERETAFALEAVADEAVFMTGPILVTLLATAVHPVAGLTSALVAGVGGTLALSAQRAHRAARAPALAVARRPPATAVGDGAAARGRLPRPRRALRCRRGHHGRVQRGAGRQGVRRRAARALGARQPHRRRPSPARSPGAGRCSCGCASAPPR